MDIFPHAAMKRFAVVALILAMPAFGYFTFDRLAASAPPVFAPFIDVAGSVVSRTGAVIRSGDRKPTGDGGDAAQETSAPAPQSRTVHAPILVYHNIRPTPARKLSAADRQYEVTPEQFEAQLALLEAEGFAAVGFDALLAAIAGGPPLPEKAVIITLDDGRDSQYQHAFPSLKKHGFTATFFVFSNAIGRPGYLTWEQLGVLRDDGMGIAGHTRYHPYLTRIADDEELRAELEVSKRMIEEKLGIEAKYLAYPFGLFDERVIAATKAAGYAGARGLEHAIAHGPDDLYSLGGFIVTGDLDRFRREILGAGQ